MSLLFVALGAVLLWALVRLGRQTERAGRGHWRIAATVMATALLTGAVVAGARGAWITAAALGGAAVWLVVASRVRSLPARRPGMTAAEARALLGVDETAGPEAINAAWRRLMVRAHPDQGGTRGLAEQLNAARDRLLRG